MRTVPFTSCLAIAILLASCVSLSLGSDESLDPKGRPEQFKQGQRTYYAVWNDDGVWSIRCTSNDKARDIKAVFTGSVRIDGDKFLGEFQGLEGSKNNKRDSDAIVLHKDKKGFDFKFVTFGKTDGVNFKVGKNAKSVTFRLLVTGDDDPKKILIGAKGRHPDKSTFTLPPLPPPKS